MKGCEARITGNDGGRKRLKCRGTVIDVMRQ
jgi:hypothetical protein